LPLLSINSHNCVLLTLKIRQIDIKEKERNTRAPPQ
jgi:hypothetical protein